MLCKKLVAPRGKGFGRRNVLGHLDIQLVQFAITLRIVRELGQSLDHNALRPNPRVYIGEAGDIARGDLEP